MSYHSYFWSLSPQPCQPIPSLHILQPLSPPTLVIHSFHASRYIKKDTPISQERLLEACRTKQNHEHHRNLAPLLNVASLSTIYSDLLATHKKYIAATGKDRSVIGDKYHMLFDALINADRNALAEMILSLTPTEGTEIAEVGDIRQGSHTNAATFGTLDDGTLVTFRVLLLKYSALSNI